MIKLKVWSSSTSIAVNPHQVTYVKDASITNNSEYGCVVYFSGDKSIHVSNDYLEVITAIGNALNK